MFMISGTSEYNMSIKRDHEDFVQTREHSARGGDREGRAGVRHPPTVRPPQEFTALTSSIRP
jgi:hypothetical protein